MKWTVNTLSYYTSHEQSKTIDEIIFVRGCRVSVSHYNNCLRSPKCHCHCRSVSSSMASGVDVQGGDLRVSSGGHVRLIGISPIICERTVTSTYEYRRVLLSFNILRRTGNVKAAIFF